MRCVKPKPMRCVKQLAIYAQEHGLSDFGDVLLDLQQADAKGTLSDADTELLDTIREQMFSYLRMYDPNMLNPKFRD
jgi:hypothetical protein